MITVCSLWGSENTLWKNVNWTWEECQLIQEICAVWGNTDVLWKNANWIWAGCNPIPETGCAKWGTTAVLWQNANWKWPECSGSISPIIPVVTIGNQPGVDATTLIQPWLIEPWNPYRTGSLDRDRKRRLVKLVCKVKGQRYEEEKEMKNFDVSIDDIRTIVQAVSGINLTLTK